MGRVHRGQVRLNVHHATVKSIKRSVKSHRKRILKAQKLRRRLSKNSRRTDEQHDYDLSGADDEGGWMPSAAAVLLKKMVSTDSDELEVDGGCSEEDQEEAAAAAKRMAEAHDEGEERGFEVDSGCDEWDLSKKT